MKAHCKSSILPSILQGLLSDYCFRQSEVGHRNSLYSFYSAVVPPIVYSTGRALETESVFCTTIVFPTVVSLTLYLLMTSKTASVFPTMVPFTVQGLS